MPLIRRRLEPLPREHMAQMSTAVCTHNFRARHAPRAIHVPLHGAGNCVEEGRPSAAGFEFSVRGVEGRVACSAVVGADSGVVLVVGARGGGLCAFLADDTELRR